MDCQEEKKLNFCSFTSQKIRHVSIILISLEDNIMLLLTRRKFASENGTKISQVVQEKRAYAYFIKMVLPICLEIND